jgi:hypothetical protein
MCVLLLLQVKSRVMAASGWPDNALTHMATALITGVVSTTATNPVDVVKTYMFVGEVGSFSKSHCQGSCCVSNHLFRLFMAHSIKQWMACVIRRQHSKLTNRFCQGTYSIIPDHVAARHCAHPCTACVCCQVAASTATPCHVHQPSTAHTASLASGGAGWPTMRAWAHRQS